MEREFRCSHCQKELQIQGSLRKRADWYMIKSELWDLVIENNKIPKDKWGHTYLCVDCLEQLLGRKLCLDDLWVKDGREIPANYWLIREVMEEYEESFNFGETIVEVAKEKQRTMSDEEYQEWLCQLSGEFAFLD